MEIKPGHEKSADPIGNGSFRPLLEQYHDRIASLHLKDRKGPGGGGPNMPWGQGETPLKEILQLMKKNKYKFPASIEFEYPTPEGSETEFRCALPGR